MFIYIMFIYNMTPLLKLFNCDTQYFNVAGLLKGCTTSQEIEPVRVSVWCKMVLAENCLKYYGLIAS